jgi:hypothetical protein
MGPVPEASVRRIVGFFISALWDFVTKSKLFLQQQQQQQLPHAHSKNTYPVR